MSARCVRRPGGRPRPSCRTADPTRPETVYMLSFRLLAALAVNSRADQLDWSSTPPLGLVLRQEYRCAGDRQASARPCQGEVLSRHPPQVGGRATRWLIEIKILHPVGPCGPTLMVIRDCAPPARPAAARPRLDFRCSAIRAGNLQQCAGRLIDPRENKSSRVAKDALLFCPPCGIRHARQRFALSNKSRVAGRAGQHLQVIGLFSLLAEGLRAVRSAKPDP